MFSGLPHKLGKAVRSSGLRCSSAFLNLETCVPAATRSEPSSVPVDQAEAVALRWRLGRGKECPNLTFFQWNQSALIQNQKEGEIGEIWSGGKGQFHFLPSS